MSEITKQTHRFIYIEAGNASHYGWKLRSEPLGLYESECPNWLGPDDVLTYENAYGAERKNNG
jgi:hypothetical protein